MFTYISQMTFLSKEREKNEISLDSLTSVINLKFKITFQLIDILVNLIHGTFTMISNLYI